MNNWEKHQKCDMVDVTYNFPVNLLPLETPQLLSHPVMILGS